MSWQHPSGIGRNNLDFVRFVLAVAVIFAHSYALLQGSDFGEPLMRFTHNQITFGGLAVAWFFVISGFLITHSWLRKPVAAEFLKKRVLRIYPGFIGAILFCTFVVVPVASPQFRQHFGQIIHPWRLTADAAILRYAEPQGAFPRNPLPFVDGSLWTIQYEFWCYVGVVLLGLSSMIRRLRVMVFWFAVALLISIVFVVGKYNPGGSVLGRIFGAPNVWARLLPYYLAGVVFYLFRNQILFSRWVALACALLMVLAARLNPWGVSLILPLAGTYFLFWFAFEPRIRLENWARHGDFSYGIYVFAFPIQQLLIMYLGAHISPLYLFAWATPICILAGFVSWHLIERRFLKLKKVHILPIHQINEQKAPAA